MINLFLTKLLPPFVYPLGAALLVGAIALALSFTSSGRIGQLLLGFALVTLWIAATPLFANWLNWRRGSKIPRVSLETMPQSDVLILLGGEPTSRILRALRVYRAGKAPLIVISAGPVPEAQLIADLLIELGAPRSALILETESRNTRENAVNTAAIFKEHVWRTGLLVTSGAHMPRALRYCLPS